METFSALLSAQRPMTRSFDVYFDLRLNKGLGKQSWGWWFETLPRSLWRHSNDMSHVCELPPFTYCHTNMATLAGALFWPRPLNSLAPGKFEWNFRHVIFKQILVIDGWDNSCEIGPLWMSLDFTDDQSTLVQVMAWCRQATSHYLNQCWSRSPTP